MTFSIIARDATTGALGIAIASRFFGVGAICPFVFSALGAISTQAAGHPAFADRARLLLAAGRDAETVLDALLETDAARERRQVHLIDAGGRSAAFTGGQCLGWAGARRDDGVSLAGNMLANGAVLDRSLAAYREGAGQPLAERLLIALEAGQSAGGDTRGQQASALLIHGSQPFPMVSLRIDNDPDAVPALRRLHQDAGTDYYPYLRGLFDPVETEAVLG